MKNMKKIVTFFAGTARYFTCLCLASCVLCLVSCVLCLWPACAEQTEQTILPQLPQTDVLISMDFRDAGLKDVLKVLSQQSGINFIPSDEVQDKKITFYLEGVPVKNAIDSIIVANGLTYDQGPDKNIFIVRNSGALKVKTITKIFTLSFAQVAPLTVQLGSGGTSTNKGSSSGSSQSSSQSSASSSVSSSSSVTPGSSGIQDILTKLLSPHGSIIVDQRTNSIVVTDIPEQFSLIEDMLKKLDTPTPQVFIEAEIVETTLDVTDKLGLDYGGTGGQWAATFTGPQKGYSFPYNTKSFKSHDQEATFTFGTMAFGEVEIALKALKSQADTRYLARPKLLTLNNETAVIDITSDTYVGSITTSEPTTQSNTTSAERMTTGVSLSVTPQVNAADYVTMILEPAVSRTEASSVNPGFLNPIKRSAKAKVMVKDGETVFIGGLLDTQKTDTNRKVPILGDVPIIGALFKSSAVTNRQSEILIFITPHIVKSRVVEEAKVVPVKEYGHADESRDKLIEEAVKELGQER